ncbi:MAG: amidohydrolase [Gemmatimonadota bacterium]|nr:MAG: amidohydrolase [Gemmatimonadota bacterium]
MEARVKYILGIATIFIGAFAGCDRATPPGQADLVLRNGRVVTMDPARPEAEALAVRGDLIVAVGSEGEIDAYIGDGTRVIDLEGQLVVPGLIEGHGHYMSLGASLMQLDLRPARDWDEIIGMVADAVDGAGPGEWIVGRGWHQDKWDRAPEPAIEGLPTHGRLSEVSPDNPVMLVHVSGHGVFVNARALQLIGVSRDTPDPEGGEFVRDEQGEPAGMLRESAQDFARAAVAEYRSRRSPEEIEAELRRQVELAGTEALANGITSFHDMGESFETIDLFKQMADEGALPVRLYVHVDESSEVMAERLAEYRMIGYGDGFLTVRAIGERVLDGALGTHGGWLLEPYSDLPRSTGFNVIPVAEIQRSAELAAQHGYQMAIQGIGDRATRELLNIYEGVFAQHPDQDDFRWRIEHCQVIHPDDLPRFAELGVIFSVRGVFATSDGPWVIARLGEERARDRGYLYQDMFRSGAVVINGTDPPVEDIDPIANFYRSVTRMMENGSVFFPEQRMTRSQALASYTVNPAYAAFEEDLKGMLSVGKLADITVLSQDIMSVPEEKILDTEVIYTIIAGKVRYSGGK